MKTNDDRVDKLAGKNLAGDCSRADFSGVEIGDTKTKTSVDGIFAGANFSNARIYGGILSGDFSNVDFEGALFIGCELLGNFNGARNLGPAVARSKIHSSASFQGADLRHAVGVFDLDQIKGCQIAYSDEVAVRTGETTLVGRRISLYKPAQYVGQVEVVDVSEVHQCLDVLHIVRGLPAQNVNNGDGIYDLDGLAVTIDGGAQSVKSPLFSMWDLGLSAPGRHFTNFNRRGTIRLWGNFNHARFTDSRIRHLELGWGTFKEFDLVRAKVRRLTIE